MWTGACQLPVLPLPACGDPEMKEGWASPCCIPSMPSPLCQPPSLPLGPRKGTHGLLAVSTAPLGGWLEAKGGNSNFRIIREHGSADSGAFELGRPCVSSIPRSLLVLGKLGLLYPPISLA